MVFQGPALAKYRAERAPRGEIWLLVDRTYCYLCAQKPSDDTVLKSFCFPLVHLVIFQENQSLGVLRMWVQVTQSWLHWPETSTVQRTPHSGGTP